MRGKTRKFLCKRFGCFGLARAIALPQAGVTIQDPWNADFAIDSCSFCSWPAFWPSRRLSNRQPVAKLSAVSPAAENIVPSAAMASRANPPLNLPAVPSYFVGVAVQGSQPKKGQPDSAQRERCRRTLAQARARLLSRARRFSCRPVDAPMKPPRER